MIKCPSCGAESTDEDFNSGNEKVGVYMNDKGQNVCECWECEYEWVEE